MSLLTATDVFNAKAPAGQEKRPTAEFAESWTCTTSAFDGFWVAPRHSCVLAQAQASDDSTRKCVNACKPKRGEAESAFRTPLSSENDEA
jgi:hypothetical protein